MKIEYPARTLDLVRDLFILELKVGNQQTGYMNQYIWGIEPGLEPGLIRRGYVKGEDIPEIVVKAFR
jgi:hypothetical protein